MRENSNEKLEKVLSEVLKLYEEGKPISEISDLFPEYKTELQELFQVIEILNKEKKTIISQKELLNKILAQIPKPVTDFETSRYLYRGEKNLNYFRQKVGPLSCNYWRR